MSMRKTIVAVAACAAAVGAVLAQVEASSSTYFLDVDPARYAGPAGQRLQLRLGDQPRAVQLSAQDEICLQLQRADANGQVISARVRALRPEPHAAADVRVVGPDISPGTYRSTPWGMLLRVVTIGKPGDDAVKPLGTDTAPVCTL
jgi:hypothetical protein